MRLAESAGPASNQMAREVKAMRRQLLALCVAAAVIGLPSLAAAQQLFDFFGQANLPANVGGSLSMFSEVRDPAPGTTPIPLDFANYDYTLVIEDLVLDSEDASGQVYSGGSITIYEDNGTAADYANPGSFTDGTAILVGVVTLANRAVLIGTIGTVNGSVDWTGGTRIGDIAPDDRNNWALLSGTNSSATQTEPGYDEAWDGKVEPQEPIVPNEETSWGRLKTDFHK